MKYIANDVKIRLPDRKELNQRCLNALSGDGPPMTPDEIFCSYTGVGGLHGLNYVDYGNYHDFSEAKKEIEQGQFFTPDALCAWVLDCVRPDKRHRIADLTCGKGSFFNHLPDEEKIYGCEIDPKSYKIARHLFPKANLTFGDIRSYNPGLFFHVVIGNPPYNLNWKYAGKKTSSQTAYILKAAELLYPGGLLAVIVPASLFGESTPKTETSRIYRQFNHVVQVSLNSNAFADLGVMNFPTKLLILQRKANALKNVPYSPELVEEKSSNTIYWSYVQPAAELARKKAPEIQLEINRAARERDETKRREDLLLYQIKAHPRTRSRYAEFKGLLTRYYRQKKPQKMSEKEWDEIRLHYDPIIADIRKALREQNKVEVDKVELVKTDDSVHYKAYSKATQEQADALNRGMPMRRITQIVPFGGDDDMRRCGPYEKLMRKKQREYRRQTKPFADMQPDPEITKWLDNWTITDKWGNHPIKLNERQLYDTNLALQKRYTYLQWSQGAGKTVSGTAQGMYRLAHGHSQYVFVVSSAISIETTWAPFLATYQIPHKVIKRRADLRRVYPGDFVLITLGRVKNYKRQIQHIVKLASRKLFLIYDEAQNSSALEENEDVGKLTKATLACFASIKYKLLMSGTSINNNVIEAYPQLYLMYNASVNMLCMARFLYYFDDESGDYVPFHNDRNGKPYPPYTDGLYYFKHSHLPERLTVFGVVQRRQDIVNAEELRQIISYTMITRTFKEVTGKDLERRTELRAVMNPEETALYEVALQRFHQLEHEYFKSTNMSARKLAQARIIAQIKIMLRICTCAPVFRDYKGGLMTGKLKAIFAEIKKIPNKRVAIGVRQNKIVRAFAQAARQYFPGRPVFTITGSEYQPHQRRDLIYGTFEDYDNSILICTQQSLSESISIDSVDYCFLAEAHWNDSRMSQFYFRFIRYTSTREKHIYYVNYPDSIETNLIFLLVSKERMLRFLKGQDISFEELFAEMGFDMAHHQGALFRKYTEDGPELYWGQQRIAA